MTKYLEDMIWAITPAAHKNIMGLVQSGSLSFFREEEPKSNITIEDSIAVISVTGDLQKNLSYWRGDCSYTQIREGIETALADSTVKAICLKIDSPGGTVDGCKELCDFIHASTKEKNFYTYADGMMCSAAYWIGSASKEIAAPILANIGSIGVRTMHIDRTKEAENHGVKVTYLTAGEYKAAGAPFKKLDSKSKNYMQERLDAIYSIFVDGVARNRGVSTEEALKMADGKVFIGKVAEEIGLIDRIEENFQTFMTRIKKKLSKRL